MFLKYDKSKFKCVECGSEYERVHIKLIELPLRSKLCQNCMTKQATEKMKKTVKTKESRLKKSVRMKKFYTTEEGIISKADRAEKWKVWSKTEAGQKHLADCGNHFPHKKGKDHPRWNPDKEAFDKYSYKVRQITNKNDLSVLENFDKPRGLCGVGGAFQLDHIISIKHGFDNNIEPEVIGSINNLQFIPWEENRTKGVKYDNL